MKRKILLLAAIILSIGAGAQPAWFPNTNNPVKLSDVIEAHEKNKAFAVDDEKEPEIKDRIKEGGDYHFNRWLWYWQQHTDENGYLVSPVKNFEESLKFRNSNSAGKSTAGNNSNWSFQGPTTSGGGYEGIGRISSIEFHPTDINTYWVCAAGGGVWKTVNDGINWTCLTDGLAVIGTSDLDVNPLNPKTMYLCPGDRDASDTYSIGVLKSTDGGATWNTTGLVYTTSQTKLTNCLVINKLDTNSLTLAASDGIYKSYNGGTTWTLKQAGNFKQVLYHPTDTNVLYATKNGSPAALYRSANGGASWTQIFSSASVQRITAAVSPAAINIVKFIACNTSNGLEGIYNSTDTGKTFTKIFTDGTSCSTNILNGSPNGNACGGQGWYDLAMAISPTNSNLVTIGGVNSWYSTNGGTSWTIANQWAGILSGVTEVHADKHYQAFQPTRPGMLFECNDGGVYKSSNISGGIWNDMTNGMGITQFYRNAVASNTTYVLGGAQDNGTKQIQGGVSNFVGGGDGMNCEIDYADSNTYYIASQNGDVTRSSLALGNADISGNIPGAPTGAWITPYIISPFNHLHMVAGYKQIYFSSNAGNSWYSLTPTALNTTKYVSRLAMTKANDSTIYAVLENSNIVYHTYNFYPGSTPTFSADTFKLGGNNNISDIKVDPSDKNHFWVTFSGYGVNKVYENKAGIWTAMNTGIPNVPVGCFEIDTATGTLYAGTDIGVYYYDTASPAQWRTFNNNLPSIEVADLGINYTSGEIWAATYGRGLWKSSKLGYVPPPDAPVDTIKNITDTSANIYWNTVSSGISFEYFISTNPIPPASGTGITGTFYHAGSLTPGTKYYVHLKTIGSTKNSVWATDNFTTTTVSVGNLHNNGWGVAVYPNPVINMATIKIPSPYTGRGQLTITDLAGKLLNTITVNDNTQEIDMSNYKSGIYIMKYTNGAYSQTFRVVKQ
jgi:hypothetical protein